MLQINQLKVKLNYSNKDIVSNIAHVLNIGLSEIKDFKIIKKSIDARKKPDVYYVLSVAVNVDNEDRVLRKLKTKDVFKYNPCIYNADISGTKKLDHPPVIVGAGPCGLFAAYELSLHGYNPVVIERGKSVDDRTNDVENFWKTGCLLPDSNVLFGEGGAGTFSDGKLNTLVKDKFGRNSHVLEVLVRFGAPEKILYENKPHIGTDVLAVVVKNMRDFIIDNGGTFLFNTKLTDIICDNDRVCKIEVNNNDYIECDALILCIGHSARDTFKMLFDKHFFMEQKDFAVGFRVEHKQDIINKALYGDSDEVLKYLPAGAYKLTYQCEKYNRGVYSFCMCPGGYVVNASSEDGRLCINGMSYSKRDGSNANSAIVMTVRNEDFKSDHPLAGIEFQRDIEHRAYLAGNGSIPYERFDEFKRDLGYEVSQNNADYRLNPSHKGNSVNCKVSSVLSHELNEAFVEAMEYFNKIIPGFNANDTIVSAVESRTSSPVRITRDEHFESINIKGVYPGGEGAGYAGGITSAAMDGIKIFEEIARRYKPIKEQLVN